MPGVTMEDVRDRLASEDKPALMKRILGRAEEDDRLRRNLLLEAAGDRPSGVDVQAYREAIDEAVRPGGFIDFARAYDYARGVSEVVESIRHLLNAGHAAEVVLLAEHALQAVEAAVDSVYNGREHLADTLDRLAEMHLQACLQARPDPKALARRLFAWELRRGNDSFIGTVGRYKDALGKGGLAEYRRRAEAEWAKVPELKPGEQDPAQDGRRSRMAQIMETLAELQGGIEARVAVMSRDLSHAGAYLDIAELHRKAGDHGKALDWAEQGLKAFPERPGSGLRLFLAEEYHRLGRHDEAMALVWADFADSPMLRHYRALKIHADSTASWPAWREQAISFLRERIAKSCREKPEGWWSRRLDHSDLVEVFLWEKDVEAAWKEAREGGCHDGLWIQLARLREKEHPQDAVEVYQRLVESTLRHADKQAYREACALMRKVHRLMAGQGKQEEFRGYLDEVKEAHARKTNFMKMLALQRWR